MTQHEYTHPTDYACPNRNCWINALAGRWAIWPQRRNNEPLPHDPPGFHRWDLAVKVADARTQTNRSKLVCPVHDKILLEIWSMQTLEDIDQEEATYQHSVRMGGW